MAQYDKNRNPGEVLNTTDARQGNRKKTNLRVLVTSLGIAVVVGIVMVAGFWKATPTNMDYSSGGKLQQQAPTPAEPQQPTPGQQSDAPKQAPPATTP